MLPESDTPVLGSDVVIVGQPVREPEPPLAVPVAVALDLDLGEQFLLVGKGLNTRLAGQLRLSAAAGQAPSATGSVRVVSEFARQARLLGARLICITDHASPAPEADWLLRVQTSAPGPSPRIRP